MELPPGRGGLVPDLGLVYDFRVTDGPVGPGWRIAGGSTIRARSETWGVWDPTPREGSAVQRYFVDGQQLVPGDPGAFAATEIDDGRQFHYDEDRNTWHAYRDGWTWIYGEWADESGSHGTCATESLVESALVHCALGPVTASLDETTAWHLSRLVDPSGNSIEWSYSLSAASPVLFDVDGSIAWEHQPAEVRWSNNRVSFEYEDRPDPRGDGSGGAWRVRARRLARLDVQADGELDAVYELGWTEAATDPMPRLDSIDRVSPDGTLTRRLRDLDPGFSGLSFAEPELVDWTASQSWDEAVLRVNLDGNGFPDLLLIHGDATGLGYEVRFDPFAPSPGADVLGATDMLDQVLGSDPAWTPTDAWDSHGWAIADVDRDLVSDVLMAATATHPRGYAARLTGGRWVAFDLALGLDPGTGWEDYSAAILERAQWADVDGDGLVDIVLPGHSTLSGAFSALGSTAMALWIPNLGHAPFFDLSEARDLAIDTPALLDDGDFADAQRWADYNGDGIADVAWSAWTDGVGIEWTFGTDWIAVEGAPCEGELWFPWCPAGEVVAGVAFGDGRGNFVEAGYDPGDPWKTPAWTDPEPYETLTYTAPTRQPEWVGVAPAAIAGRPGLIGTPYGAAGDIALADIDDLDAALYFRRDLGIGAGWDVFDPAWELPGYALDVRQEQSYTQLVADWDGDGLEDVLRLGHVPCDAHAADCDGDGDDPASVEARFYRNTSAMPEGRLAAIETSWGGRIELSWTTSALSGDSPNLPFALAAIATVSDERGPTAYRFDGGTYDPEYGNFRGFAQAITSLPTGARQVDRFATSPEINGALVYTADHRADGSLWHLRVHNFGALGNDPILDDTKPYFNGEVRRCDFDVGHGEGVLATQSVDVETLVSTCQAQGPGGAQLQFPGQYFSALGWARAFGWTTSPQGGGSFGQCPANASGCEGAHTLWQAEDPSFVPDWAPTFPVGASGWAELSEDFPAAVPAPASPGPRVGGGTTTTEVKLYMVDTTWDGEHRVSRVYDHRDTSIGDDDVRTEYVWDAWDGVAAGKQLIAVKWFDGGATSFDHARSFDSFVAFNLPQGITEHAKSDFALRAWWTTWDHGDPVSRSGPMGYSETWVRNSCGQVSQHVDAVGRVETTNHERCRRVSRAWQDRWETWDHDALNRVSSHVIQTAGAPGTEPTTETWYRDDGAGPDQARMVRVLGGDNLEFSWLDAWGRPIQTATCAASGAVTSYATASCTPETVAYRFKGYAVDGSLRVVTDAATSAASAASRWTWTDEAGRVEVEMAPAPVDPASPAWLTTETWHEPGSTTTLDPAGVECVRASSTRESETSCEGELRGAERFDAFGRLVRRTDGEGVSVDTLLDAWGRAQITQLAGCVDTVDAGCSSVLTETHYDDLGRVSEVIDPSGTTRATTWDDVGRPLLTTLSSPWGGPVQLESNTWLDGPTPMRLRVDVNGTLSTSMIDGMGRVWGEGTLDLSVQRVWDDAGRMVQEATTHGGSSYTTSYAYDARGGLLSQIDPAGGETTWVRDAAGRATSRLDPDLVEDVFDHAWNGAAWAWWRGLEEREAWEYDSAGRLERHFAGGATTRIGYDALGRASEACVGELGADCAFSLAWSYDGADRVSSETRDGAATSWTYNVLGWTETQTSPDLSVQSWDHDVLGRARRHTDGEGVQSTVDYDWRGRVIADDGPGRGARAWAWADGTADPDQLASVVVTEADGGSWGRWVDSLGRTRRESRPDGSGAEQSWAGLLLQERRELDASGGDIVRTVRGYDAAGRLAWEWGPTEDFSSASPPVGAWANSYEWTAAGRIERVEGPNDETIFGWDNGHMVSELAVGVSSRSWTYDDHGRLEAGSVGASRTWTRGYTPDGMYVGTETWSEGDPGTEKVRVLDDFDAWGTPRTQALYTGGALSSAYVLATDTLGRTTHVQQTVDGWTATADWEYYRNGALKTATVDLPSAPARGLRYIRGGSEFALARIDSDSGAVLAQVLARDTMGRATELSVGSTLTERSWDQLGRLESLYTSTGPSWEERVYAYDELGRMTHVELDGSSGPRQLDHGWSPEGWLLDEWTSAGRHVAYGYDVAGNRLTRTETDGTGVSTTSYGYAYGNVLSSVDGASPVWNDKGEVEVDHRGWGLWRDAEGQEVGVDDGTELVATVVRDPWGLPLQVRDEAADRTVRGVWGGGAWPLAQEESELGMSWLNLDIDGELVGRFDGGVQAVVLDGTGTPVFDQGMLREAAQAFGEGTTATTGAPGTPTYAGLALLPGTPYHLSRSRLYDPELGRWAGEDPIGLGGGAQPLHLRGQRPHPPLGSVGVGRPSHRRGGRRGAGAFPGRGRGR